MSDSLPMMPWYPRDWIAATRQLAPAERGAYRELLDFQWELGALPNDPKRLAMIIGYPQELFDEVWPSIASKFAETEAGLQNIRLEEHRKRALNLTERRRQGARIANAKRNAERNAERAHPEPEPSIKKTSPSGSQKKARKQQLPQNWKPSPELLAWKAEKFPNVNTQHETEKFTDHWHSKAETRADWDATWRNWIRKASEISNNGTRNGNGQKRLSAVDRVRRATGVRL